jgi:carbon starvation protein CstA
MDRYWNLTPQSREFVKAMLMVCGAGPVIGLVLAAMSSTPAETFAIVAGPMVGGALVTLIVVLAIDRRL